MLLKLKILIASLFKKIIFFLSKTAKIDLLPLAYKNIGIMKSYGFGPSGERFLIQRLNLPLG